MPDLNAIGINKKKLAMGFRHLAEMLDEGEIIPLSVESGARNDKGEWEVRTLALTYHHRGEPSTSAFAGTLDSALGFEVR